MAWRVLLIEDEAPLARAIALGLEKAGYQVECCANGIEGFEKTIQERYDAVLLDLMLPGMDGWTLCRRMRDRRDTTPILMLTARDEVEDRVRGLEMGADDYLPKPFAFAELKARVAALIRRGGAQRRRLLKIADLEIDTEAKQVRRGGRDLWLTPKEFELLELLAAREGDVVTREAICARLWPEGDTYSNSLEVHVASLRRKIDSDRPEKLLHTAHRRGYVLRAGAPPGEP